MEVLMWKRNEVIPKKMSVLEETGKSSCLKRFLWASGNMVILIGVDSKKEPKICLEPYYGYPAL